MRRLPTFKVFAISALALIVDPFSGNWMTHSEASAQIITPQVRSCLKIRKSPDGTALGCLRSGVELEVVKTAGNWSLVKHNGKQGWVYSANNRYVRVVREAVSASSVQTAPAATTEAAANTSSVSSASSNSSTNANSSTTASGSSNSSGSSSASVITPIGNSCLRLRTGPSTATNATACINPGMEMKVVRTNKQGNWVEVQTPRGNGWVYKDFTGLPGELVNVARSTKSPVQSVGRGAETWRTNPSGSVTCNKNETNPLKCMVCNAHFEARSEPRKGREAVHYVVFNRVQSPKFPNDICRVVYQPNQFSWTRGATKRVPASSFKKLQEEAIAALNEFLSGELDQSNIAACSDHYVNPTWASRASLSWRRKMSNLGKVGRHQFYRSSGSRCFDGTGEGYNRLARAAGIPLDSGRAVASLSTNQSNRSTRAVQ